MKDGIHPEYHPECKVYFRGEHVMTVGATVPEMHVDASGLVSVSDATLAAAIDSALEDIVGTGAGGLWLGPVLLLARRRRLDRARRSE